MKIPGKQKSLPIHVQKVSLTDVPLEHLECDRLLLYTLWKWPLSVGHATKAYSPWRWFCSVTVLYYAVVWLLNFKDIHIIIFWLNLSWVCFDTERQDIIHTKYIQSRAQQGSSSKEQKVLSTNPTWSVNIISNSWFKNNSGSEND